MHKGVRLSERSTHTEEDAQKVLTLSTILRAHSTLTLEMPSFVCPLSCQQPLLLRKTLLTLRSLEQKPFTTLFHE